MPSPDINAPSPSSGSDIEMPEENKTGKIPYKGIFIIEYWINIHHFIVYDSEKSFIGTDFVTAMNNAAHEKHFQYSRSLDQSYDIESNQSQYSVHGLPSYDPYQQPRDMTIPLQEYYSVGIII